MNNFEICKSAAFVQIQVIMRKSLFSLGGDEHSTKHFSGVKLIVLHVLCNIVSTCEKVKYVFAVVRVCMDSLHPHVLNNVCMLAIIHTTTYTYSEVRGVALLSICTVLTVLASRSKYAFTPNTASYSKGKRDYNKV